ncbi:MAG: SDR family oxidoreductase [Hyphomicrobiales bacterium]|nr:SDR family oxidoreductase [Hyphomicrobiales bacterium]
MSERKVALITGASEGLGVEFARVFAARGHDLALVARRQDKLEALADEIAGRGRPRPLVIALDLAPPEAPQRLREALAAAGASVEYLVNNAGYGLNGAFADLPAEDQTAMVDLNCRALTALTRLFLPDLERHRGGLLNVASIAAFAPGPGMAVYYASKAYVLSLTEALAEELRPAGVRVSALCPGPVLTGFQSRAGMGGSFQTPPGVASARETVEAGYAGLMAGRRVVVPGVVNQALAAGMAWIPHGISLPQLAARQAKRRPQGSK